VVKEVEECFAEDTGEGEGDISEEDVRRPAEDVAYSPSPGRDAARSPPSRAPDPPSSKVDLRHQKSTSAPKVDLRHQKSTQTPKLGGGVDPSKCCYEGGRCA